MSKIIAEIGVNWNGDIETAKEMIFQSKRAGADAVKFQMFNYDIIKGHKYEVELSEMILHYLQLNILRGYAFQNNIEFGVSTMYPEAFDIIRQIGLPVDFIKIRCCDNCNEKVARPAVKYCDDYNIPLLISTEIPVPVDDYFRCNIHNTKNAKYLYCVPKYPPELNEICDSYINADKFDGYSNHIKSKYFPMIAVARNIEYVEIHVMNIGTNSIDENVSLNFEDLYEVCEMRNMMLKMR